MSEVIIFKLFIFLLGLAIGSFANVILIRLPDEKSLGDRSRCPSCQKKIKWYDLVPIVSFFLLKKRCRFCGQKISWQYFFIELIYGSAFLLTTFTVLEGFLLSWFLVFISVSLLLILYDLKHFILPNEIVAFLFLWVLLGSFVFWRDIIGINLLVGIVFFSFFWVIYILSGGRWIGGGDVKLVGVLGFLLGWPHSLIMLALAYLTGAFVGVFLLISKKYGLKSKIPFGPFLILGTFLAFFWGREIINWYFNLIL